jgi:hypothetical protein
MSENHLNFSVTKEDFQIIYDKQEYTSTKEVILDMLKIDKYSMRLHNSLGDYEYEYAIADCEYRETIGKMLKTAEGKDYYEKVSVIISEYPEIANMLSNIANLKMNITKVKGILEDINNYAKHLDKLSWELKGKQNG